MIRAAATTDDGRTLVILGLSDANLERLRAGQPIMFDADELGVDALVTIVGGRDEDAIRGQLGEWFTLPDEEGPTDG